MLPPVSMERARTWRLKGLGKVIMIRRRRPFLARMMLTRRRMVWSPWKGRTPPCRSPGLPHPGQGVPGLGKFGQNNEVRSKILILPTKFWSKQRFEDRPKTDLHIFIAYLVISVICRFEGHGLEFCVHFAGALRTKRISPSQLIIKQCLNHSKQRDSCPPL